MSISSRRLSALMSTAAPQSNQYKLSRCAEKCSKNNSKPLLRTAFSIIFFHNFHESEVPWYGDGYLTAGDNHHFSDPTDDKTTKSEIEKWKRASETLQPDGVPWAKMATVLIMRYRFWHSLWSNRAKVKKNRRPRRIVYYNPPPKQTEY